MTTGGMAWLGSIVPVVLAAWWLLPAAAIAQGTDGELAGRVVDRAGRPVPAVRVALPALDRVAVTDADGRFRLADLPAGAHAARLSRVDGAWWTATLRVSALQRERIEITLGDRGAGDGAVVRSRALPLASGATVTGDDLRALPVDDTREALRSVSGVVETDAADGPALRGGFPGDAPVFVDGVPWRIASNRGFGFGVPVGAVEEIGVWTGPLGPAFGDAQSGVIHVVTRSGGPGIDGRLTAATDGLFGSGTSVGFNRFDAEVGGTLGRRLSVFAAVALQGEDAGRRGAGTDDVMAFVPGGTDTVVTDFNGVDSVPVAIPALVQVSGSCDAATNENTGCRGRALPYDWRTALAGTVRADWRYGHGSGLSATVFLDRTQRRFWPGALAFDPAAYMGERRSASAFTARWMQRLGDAVRLDVALSRQAADLVSGVLDTAWEAGHRDPRMGIDLSRMGFLVDFDRFSADTGARAVTRLQSADDWDRLITNTLTNTGTRVPLLDQNQYRLAQPYRMNPWAAATGLPTVGLDAGYSTLGQQRYWLARGVATVRPVTFARVRAGADWQASELRWFEGQLLRQTYLDLYVERPRQMGVFGDVRFAAASALLELGVRWERFDANTIFSATPGRIFTHPNFDPNDPTNPADSVFVPSRVRDVVLPSVRAAWAPLSGTAIRAGVARQARHPDESLVYGRKNADLSFTTTSSGFGRDVDWPRSWLIELGVQQAMGTGIVGDVGAWLEQRDRDVVYGPQRYYDPVVGDSIRVIVASNFDPASSGSPVVYPTGRMLKGLDAGIAAWAGAWLEARMGYSFRDAGETLGTSTSRKHTVAGRLGLRSPAGFDPGWWLGPVMRDAEVWMLFRVASGLPYTRTVNSGLGTISPSVEGQAAESFFASTTPAIRELDLRIVKRFTTGALRWGLVLDARNFLRFGNTLRVFTETGTTTNENHRALVVNAEVDRLESEGRDRLVTTGTGVQAVDLRGDCSTWGSGAVNCTMLRRAEARWGNGDGLYDRDEQETAFGALYDLFYGPWTLQGTPRHLRLGVEITL